MGEEKRILAMMLKQKPLITMGLKNISQNRKIRTSSIKGEGDVDCVFLFVCGNVAHHEFSPCAHNVNKQYYLEVMKHLWEAVKGKRANWRREKYGCYTIIMFPHIHSPWITCDLLIKNTTRHSTSSLTKSPTNRFLLVPRVEIHIERSNIESDDNIHENLQTKLCALPQKAFQQCSQKQRVHWELGIRSTGNYFERDKVK